MDDVRHEQLAHSLFREVSDALFLFQPTDDRLVDANPAALRLSGFSRQALLGRPVRDLVSSPDPTGLDRLNEAVGKTGRLRSCEGYFLRRAAGEPLPVNLSVSRVQAHPNPLGLVVARDISERLEATALRQARNAAELANQAKNTFLALVSHEARAPLTTILGLCEALLEGRLIQTAPAEALRELQAIQHNGRMLLDMLGDLLDLTKVELGRLRVELAPTNPERIAAEVVAAVRPTAVSKGLALALECAEDVPSTIQTDGLRLRQVLMNLLTNAVKFTRSGSVRLRLGLVREGSGPACLRFDVVDTGIGLSEAEQARLFEPFYRAHPHAPDGPSGSGLGLAISRRLAEALGGRLEVESAADQGSTFRLSLPVRDHLPVPEEPDSKEHTPAPRASLPRETLTGPARILLAEDNAANQRIIALRLQQAGIQVECVANGQAALDAVAAAQAAGRPFRLILLDMQMPILDGYEAARQLRDRGFRQPIIALTAHARDDDLAECLRFGCDDHLTKPIDWAQLQETVSRRLLGGAGPSSETQS